MYVTQKGLSDVNHFIANWIVPILGRYINEVGTVSKLQNPIVSNKRLLLPKKLKQSKESNGIIIKHNFAFD
jgi:hypothetical protein